MNNTTSLKSFNTLSINVNAKKIIYFRSIQKLKKIWNDCKLTKTPFLILGKGSNTLFLENYKGVVAINKIKGITIIKKKLVVTCWIWRKMA